MKPLRKRKRQMGLMKPNFFHEQYVQYGYQTLMFGHGLLIPLLNLFGTCSSNICEHHGLTLNAPMIADDPIRKMHLLNWNTGSEYHPDLHATLEQVYEIGCINDRHGWVQRCLFNHGKKIQHWSTLYERKCPSQELLKPILVYKYEEA